MTFPLLPISVRTCTEMHRTGEVRRRLCVSARLFHVAAWALFFAVGIPGAVLFPLAVTWACAEVWPLSGGPAVELLAVDVQGDPDAPPRVWLP